MKQIVIRINLSEDLPDEIHQLALILSEKKKFHGHKKISGWRTGKRALSERGLALMLDSIKIREEQTNSLKTKDM